MNFEELQKRAKEMKIKGWALMKEETLRQKVAPKSKKTDEPTLYPFYDVKTRKIGLYINTDTFNSIPFGSTGNPFIFVRWQ